MHSHLFFDKLQDFKDTLISSSIEVTKHTKIIKERDPNLWEAVRLVSAIDQGIDNIKKNLPTSLTISHLVTPPIYLLKKSIKDLRPSH